MSQIVLITGASKGLGKATAELLHDKGYTVYGTSRDPQISPDYDLLPLDVTDDDSVKRCIEQIISENGRLDVLVNNAGFGMTGPLEDATVEDLQQQFETNFFGVHRMVRAVLPQMKKQGTGKIITIGSFGGRLALPFQAIYSASKAAVAMYSDGLRMELMRFGIQVALIEPGDTKSDFDTGRRRVTDYNPEENPIAERALDIMRHAEHNGASPQWVAKTVYSIIRNKKVKPRYTTGWDAKILGVLQRFLPYTLQERLIMMNYKVPRKL